MIIQPFTETLLVSVKALQPDGWTDLVPVFRYYLKAEFCYPIAVIEQGRLAGVGNAICYKNTAWLSCIIVHPEFRNRGLGSMITNALMEHIDRTRFETVLLDATEFGYPVYLKSGFEVVNMYVHLNGPGIQATGEEMKKIIPFEPAFKEQVLMLDQQATDEDRIDTLEDFMAGAFVYLSDNHVGGVYYPLLGRKPVIASTFEAGIALMKLRSQTEREAMLPADNIKAVDFLLSHGYTLSRQSRRMVSGKERNWAPTFIYQVISGAKG